jgi:hypothetical protein
VIFAVAVEEQRLPLPDGIEWCGPLELRGLIEECWGDDPVGRPAFSEVEARVVAVRRRLANFLD